ncbi:MAG: rRNA pseudouridine synthase [Planctomycetes bacterium]|nr:rRNA pseudouridine synthase [Planctomycetota bacterium]
MVQLRLQKILADAGIASRRRCEEFIQEGRVAVGGEVVTSPGVKADPETDDIRFDGAPLRIEQRVYFLVNKPRGYICTNASEGKKRVIDLLAGRIPQRVYPVGRLDVDSEGLIILTNDGDLANHLAHPRYGVEKTYQVKVEGRPDRKDLEKLSRGTHLAEGRTEGIQARIGRKDGRFTWLETTLREGKNREIRRILARLGYRVKRLRRVAIAGITDPRLKPGAFRRLTRTEVERLRKAGGRTNGKR